MTISVMIKIIDSQGRERTAEAKCVLPDTMTLSVAIQHTAFAAMNQEGEKPAKVAQRRD